MRSVSVTTRRKLSGAAPVYNLAVEGEHEYFANGFLVHNCDSLEMGIQMLLTLLQGEQHQGPKAYRA